MKVKKYCVLSILVAGIFAIACWASGTDSECQCLVGLQGVTVVVKDLPAEANRYGLTKQVLKTDTELQLRQYGITVLPAMQTTPLPTVPMLEIAVLPVIKEKLGIAAVGISVKLRQIALLERDPTIRCPDAATWQKTSVVVVELDKLKSVRETVKDFVDEFTNDYLAANPQPKLLTHGLITGLAYCPESPSAIIDGQIVYEGDIIHGVKVVKIHKDHVEFAKNDKRWSQKVREPPKAFWKQ